MADDRSSQFAAEALAKVDAFIAEHPECTRHGVKQPPQGATNQVVFARRGSDLVVFKVFCSAERKQRECFGLLHWRETGLVPELVCDAGPRMIVMSHVPGTSLAAARVADGEAVWPNACREAAKAIGLLTAVPMGASDRAAFESRFYDGLGSLEAYLGRILELGRSIHQRDPDFRDGFWRDSVGFVEGQVDAILSQPRVLYHQDVSNLHVQQGRFAGFYDLEMCRVGCAAMQLASSLSMLAEKRQGWEPFCEGWEAATNAPLARDDRRAAAACMHLLKWREISRYLSYDGSVGSGYDWASPADPTTYREAIEEAENMLEVDR